VPEPSPDCPHLKLHAHGVRVGKDGEPYRRRRCADCGKVVGSPSHVRGPARGHRSPAGSQAWHIFERTFRKRLIHVGIPNAIADASKAAGVSRATASRWLNRFDFNLRDECPERAAFITLAWRFYRGVEVERSPGVQHGRLFEAIMSGDAAGPLTEEWTSHGPRLWRALLRAHAMAAVVTGKEFPWWLRDLGREIRDPAVRRLRRTYQAGAIALLPPCRVIWSGELVRFVVIRGSTVVGLWQATLSDFPDVEICVDIGGQAAARRDNYVQFSVSPIHFTLVSDGSDWVHEEPEAAHANEIGRMYLRNLRDGEALIPLLAPRPRHEDWDGVSPFAKREMLRRGLSY
jgi:hypothetical protein